MMAGGGRKDFAWELLTKMRHNINEEEAKEMESDGGIDLNELETVFAKGGLKPSTMVIEKFNELDTNKNGKIEESEVESEGSGEGEDYGLVEDDEKCSPGVRSNQTFYLIDELYCFAKYFIRTNH